MEGALERLEQLEALEPREQLLQGLLYEVYQRDQLDRDCKKVLRHMKDSVSVGRRRGGEVWRVSNGGRGE